MKQVFILIGILLLSTALVSANGNHQAISEEGRKLVDSNVGCEDLTKEQLETVGEYFMEQMHPGEAHENMHEIMGIEEGTEYHERFHVNIAKMMYCGEGGMMGSGMMNMMPMMMNMMGNGNTMGSGGMMDMMGGQNMQSGMMQGMMGYGFGYWNFVNVLYIILLIGLIILVYLWIIKLWKNMKTKGGKK
jgi:hypothetical protein